MKSLLKLILPSFVKKLLSKFALRRKIWNFYKYDMRRFLEHSNSYISNNNQEKLLGLITAEYHVIEKGLTMPKMRLEFGTENIKNLIQHCNFYSEIYDTNNEQFLHAIAVIAEYEQLHKKEEYILDEQIVKSILSLKSIFEKVKPAKQISMKKEEFFININSSFPEFSNST